MIDQALQHEQYALLSALKELLPGKGEGISVALGVAGYLPDGKLDLPVVMTHSTNGAAGSRLTKDIITSTTDINNNYHEFAVHKVLAFCVDSPTEPASVLLFAIDSKEKVEIDQRAFIVDAVEQIEAHLDNDMEVTWVYGSLLQDEAAMKKYY